MNAVDILLVCVVAAALFFAARGMRKNAAKGGCAGCGQCGGACAGCKAERHQKDKE